MRPQENIEKDDTISAVRFLMMQELRREDEKYDVEYMDKLIAVHNKVMGMP